MNGKTRKEMGMAPAAQPAPRTFGYAETETALAKMFDATDVQRTSFRGRIQHFRKCGLPQKRTGKGSRVRYSAEDIFQLVLAFEFAELGVDPKLIIQIIRRHWRLRIGLYQAIDYAQKFPGDDFLVAIEANFMSWAWNREKFKRTDTEISTMSVSEPVYIHYFRASQGDALLKELQMPGKRFFVFNLSTRVRDVEKALAEQ
jgi:hypothetical protein